MGEKKLGPLVTSFRHHRQTGFQGYEDRGYLRLWVPHLKTYPVFRDSPGKWVSCVQTSQDVLYSGCHKT